MSIPFLQNIDLNKNELQNAVIQNVATDPDVGGSSEGQVIFNTTSKQFKIFNNTAWVNVLDTYTHPTTEGNKHLPVGGSSNQFLVWASAGTAAWGNSSDTIHGTRSGGTLHADATTSTDGFMSSADKTKLDNATSAATVSALMLRDASGRARVVAPSHVDDIANKAYVDGLVQGLDIKESCRVATTANLTLVGALVVDGITLTAGDRILVKNQTTASENGIYTFPGGSSPWVRADDFVQGKVTSGAFTFVEAGTVNADSGWVLSTTGAITVGTTSLTFTQFSGAGSITAGTALTKTGNTLNVTLGTAAETACVGNDSRLSDARTPTSHTHGGITNAGAIGGVSGLPIKTGSAGVLEVGAFGSAAGSFAEGNHAHGAINNNGTIGVAANKVITTATGGGLVATDQGNAFNKAFGTAAGTVCQGNDSRIHTRSHAMTSTSDHTSGNWKIFASNGSGQITEIGFGTTGTVLTSGGATTAPSWAAVDVGDKLKKYTVYSTPGTSQIVTHNLGTTDVTVNIYKAAADYDQVYASVQHTSINTITIGWGAAVGSGEYRIVVIG